MAVTIMDYYKELERICNIICFRKIDTDKQDELDYLKKNIRIILGKLAEIREDKQRAIEERQERKRQKYIDSLPFAKYKK